MATNGWFMGRFCCPNQALALGRGFVEQVRMNEPKLHHYVPRFYLRHFLDAEDQLWIYDKNTDKVFKTTPDRIAAETHFYRLPESLAGGNDPLSIEKALSHLESKASAVIARMALEAAHRTATEGVALSDEERALLSEFISAQHFRTLELRDLLLFLMEDTGIIEEGMDAQKRMALHVSVLSGSGLVEELADSIYHSIWIFAKNSTATPFITSDHPVCFKNADNRSWIKGIEPLENGRYIVFPISPTLILFCKEPGYWSGLQKFDLCISPVSLDNEMVDHENCGQAFMASRFLISCTNNFQHVRDFIPSIGTDMYAQQGQTNTEAVKRTANFNSKRRRRSK
ncbi:MAG: DUF4238 domain-containing protein [Sinimarinibacterium flocculans]|uniref:DUF4238 domain-containing protein n=1 Tax=Sinimarinibacterium flocculans TaxID=985250 RepID=UPI003C55083A